MDPGWILAAIALATLVVGSIGWLLRSAWRLGRRTWEFMDDYFGRPAEHGRPAIPGVMERLSALEGGIADIRTQVHLDSGHSLKDVVTRTEAAVTGLQKSVDALSQKGTP